MRARSPLACHSRHAAPGPRFTLSPHDFCPDNGSLVGEGLSLPDGRSLRRLRSLHDAHSTRSTEEVVAHLQSLLHQLREQTVKMERIVADAVRNAEASGNSPVPVSAQP